jgi:PAS domain S-box-containing protein
MSQHTVEELTKKNEALEKENERLRRVSRDTKQQAESLQTILDTIPAPIYLKNAKGKYIWINRKYEYLSNVTLKEIKGKTDFDIFPAPVAEMFRSQDEDVKKTKTPLEFEEKVSLVGGEYTFITLKFPVTDIHGNIDGVGGFCTNITERIEYEKEKECLIKDLHRTLDEVTVLRGILPICSSCKSIRDDEGYWNKIEQYLVTHSEVRFTHSLCRDCATKLHPDLADEDGKFPSEMEDAFQGRNQKD